LETALDSFRRSFEKQRRAASGGAGGEGTLWQLAEACYLEGPGRQGLPEIENFTSSASRAFSGASRAAHSPIRSSSSSASSSFSSSSSAGRFKASIDEFKPKQASRKRPRQSTSNDEGLIVIVADGVQGRGRGKGKKLSEPHESMVVSLDDDDDEDQNGNIEHKSSDEVHTIGTERYFSSAACPALALKSIVQSQSCALRR